MYTYFTALYNLPSSMGLFLLKKIKSEPVPKKNLPRLVPNASRAKV